MPELLTATVIITLIAVAIFIYLDHRYLKPKWDYHHRLNELVNHRITNQEGRSHGTRRY